MLLAVFALGNFWDLIEWDRSIGNTGEFQCLFPPKKTYIAQYSISLGRNKLLSFVDSFNIIPGSKFLLALLYQNMDSSPLLQAHKTYFLFVLNY